MSSTLHQYLLTALENVVLKLIVHEAVTVEKGVMQPTFQWARPSSCTQEDDIERCDRDASRIISSLTDMTLQYIASPCRRQTGISAASLRIEKQSSDGGGRARRHPVNGPLCATDTSS